MNIQLKFTASVLGLAMLGLGFSGCQQELVHRKSVAVLAEKAKVLLEKGDAQGAVCRLEAAHDLDPGEANIHHNLAIALYQNGQLDEAMRTFDELYNVARDKRKRHEYASSIGTIMEQKADQLSSKAEELYSPDPNNPEPRVSAEQQHQAMTMRVEALSLYEKAIERFKPLIHDDFEDKAEIQKHVEQLEQRVNALQNMR